MVNLLNLDPRYWHTESDYVYALRYGINLDAVSEFEFKADAGGNILFLLYLFDEDYNKTGELELVGSVVEVPSNAKYMSFTILDINQGVLKPSDITSINPQILVEQPQPDPSTFINPNKYIRQAIIQALSPLPTYNNRVPKSTNTPVMYAVIESQGKIEFANYKRGNEWEVNLNLSLYHRNPIGNDMAHVLDDEVERIIPLLKDLNHPIIGIKNATLESERDMTFDTDTNTINRKILTYTFWTNYGD